MLFIFVLTACQRYTAEEKNKLSHMTPKQKKCFQNTQDRQSQFVGCRITECGKYAFCPGRGTYVNGSLQGQVGDNEMGGV